MIVYIICKYLFLFCFMFSKFGNVIHVLSFTATGYSRGIKGIHRVEKIGVLANLFLHN